MRISRLDPDVAKGWLDGPWRSDLPISIGYATHPPDEPHEHPTIVEIFLVARGSATIRVEDESVPLVAGDVLVTEPGEAHTFLSCSDDFLQFVVHAPGAVGVSPAEAKRIVARSRLGL